MIFQKNLKAGILLHSLFLSAIFILVLQAYLDKMLASERIYQAQLQSQTAYLLAEWTSDLRGEKLSGQLSFDQGISNYKLEEEVLAVEVVLKTGRSYLYQFQVKAAEKELEAESKVEEQASGSSNRDTFQEEEEQD